MKDGLGCAVFAYRESAVKRVTHWKRYPLNRTFAEDYMDYLVARELNGLYILLDIVFLILFAMLILKFGKRLAFLFGIGGAFIYFLVDYGIFYLLLGTREVIGANAFWFLLWLSTSYGFTNFVWIWLFLNKDKRILEWSIFIVIGWIAVAMISQSFGSGFRLIQISRGINSYHGSMALILFVGYAIVIFKNLKAVDETRLPLVRMLFIGIVVQFSWEAVLLLTGIRPNGLNPLIVNSLLETNLGIPYLFFLHRAITKKYNEDLTKVLAKS
ncbi:MAG: hypothetical protein MZW92_33705 [Comamonadaceae bacterium]|nr:hypothetical protein [Comamonadaceae bacterium]